MKAGPARLRPEPVLAAALVGIAFPALAVESLQGRIAAISGDEWRISGFEFSITLSDAPLQGNVRIDMLELPSAELSFADVTVDCGRITLSAADYGCLEAGYSLELPGIGRVHFPGEAIYERATGATRFTLRDIPVAGGKVALRGTVSDDSVDIEYSGEQLQLELLAGLAERIAQESLPVTAMGTGNLSGMLKIRGRAVSQVSMKAELTDASLSNETGTLVTDAMHSLVDLSLAGSGGRWQFAIETVADAGEVYVEPVYVNLGDGSVTFSADGHAADDLTDIVVTRFAVSQGSAIDAAGDLRVRVAADDTGTLLGGSIELEDSSVDAIYSGLLQVLLAGTAVGDMETTGTVAGKLEFEANELTALRLSLENLSADDGRNRFGVYGLNGVLRWAGPGSDAADAEPSHLSWDSASAWNIPLGKSEIDARLGGDDFQLVKAVRVPTMGGAVLINRLVVRNFGKQDASALLDAELEPIELGQLTGAFGWPAFAGSLSGRVPLLQYDGGVVTLGGTLSARAFDGDIEFANLRLEEPLGLVPRLYGDLTLRQVDLEQLTDTFSFGLIQGRLSGDVTGLELIAWEPVAMDLHLYTPLHDSSRHRISQRAVENLASVGGGGAAAALSSGFMKFFDEFSYDRIGIRCILKDGTCSMSGAGPAGESQFGQGYYIVKGSGLPRIDVVGYRHQVSWNALVRQLDSITKSGAPVVN